jgi:DNA-binding transcriptional regulator YiaG
MAHLKAYRLLPDLLPGQIVKMRKNLGFKAVELARLLHVTPETMSRWENGKKVMPKCEQYLLRLMHDEDSGA